MKTKEQLVNRLELDTALMALAASESGILAGAGVTLGVAALGVPALIGAVAFAGFTLVAAVTPDSVNGDLEEVEEGADYFSLPVLAAMPLSPFFSPSSDPFLAAKVAGYLYDTTEIGDSLYELSKSAVPAAAGAASFQSNIQKLGAYWASRSNSGSQTSNSKATKAPTERNRGTGGEGHDRELRQFLGHEPSTGETKGGKDKTKENTTSGNSSGASDHTLDKLEDQFNKESGGTPSQEDRGTYDKDEKNERSFWNDPSKPMTNNTAPGNGNSGSGHEREFEFHPGSERMAGGGEGDDRGAGHIA